MLALRAPSERPAQVGNQTAPGTTRTATKAEPQFTLLQQKIHGGINVPVVVVVGASNRFSFLPPRTWRAQRSAEPGEMLLEAPEGAARFAIRIVERASPKDATLTPELFSRQFAKRFPSPKVLKEFPAFALNETGAAWDVDWTPASGSRHRSRCGFVPFPGGHVEFTLTARAEQFPSQESVWDAVLLSFRRSNRDGQLELPSVTPE
ncbi:MAG: hypothetical protein HYY24_28835 [Verrucomicrobia bacterium]|nr:hypothetical protein [Verrucomicrobiota bacterium]